MKRKIKMVTLTTVCGLTLAFSSQSFAAVNPFMDLTNVSAKDKIISLQENGYVVGISTDRFAPNESITAAQSVQLIVSALGLNLDLVKFAKEPKATNYYPNANNEAWYANALIIAAVNGIELPADLDPGKHWTREEFTHQLMKAIETHSNLPMIKLAPVEIKDQDQLTIDYDGSIQRALAYNVVSLDAEGNFNPKDEITRAEAAVQIYNALEYMKEHPAPAPEPTE